MCKPASCGPWWLRRALREELSKHFNLACEAHDYHYANKTYSRRKCDRIFLRHMLILSRDDKRLRRYAYAYYYSVRLGGWLSYGRRS